MNRAVLRGSGTAALAALALLSSCSAAKPAKAPPLPPPPVAAPAPAPTPADITLTGELTQGGWARGRVSGGPATLSLDGKPVALAADGSFLLAFDRDSAGTAALLASFADGRSLSRSLTIAPRSWRLEQIDTDFRPPALGDAEYQRLRASELAQINAARMLGPPSEGWRQNFIWPVKGRISGLFGSQRVYRGKPGSYHSGIDIATGASGTPFVAPADGVVVLAAATPFTLEGHLLMIDHGMGLSSAFLHCSELAVKPGDVVHQGQYIGRIGMSGRATGPHLHWGLKWREARLDPLLFTGPMR